MENSDKFMQLYMELSEPETLDDMVQERLQETVELYNQEMEYTLDSLFRYYSHKAQNYRFKEMLNVRIK